MNEHLSGFWLVFLTAVIVIWYSAGLWEWILPDQLQLSLQDWTRKCRRQTTQVPFANGEPIIDQEKNAWAIKYIVLDFCPPCGSKQHVEVVINRQSDALTEEEFRYMDCLARVFPEITWRVCPREVDAED